MLAIFLACLLVSVYTRRVVPLREEWKQTLLKTRIHPTVPQVVGTDLPVSFDGRTQWPGCIQRIEDQGNCGSCWAFAATEALSDRFCIHSNGTIRVVLSPQAALSCESWNLGCTLGSLPNLAWSFLHKTGVPTVDCVPYVSGDGKVPSCPTQCSNGEPWKIYKAQNYSHVGSLVHPSKHVDAIMRAIMQGPVDATFDVWSDFDNYKAGQVYEHKSGSYEGLHSVKVIGWGVQNGIDYWLVQNSWGPNWGDHGFFKIRKGVDECFFEALVYTGFPAL